MKKVLVVLVLVVLTMGSAFAQKGTWYIGTSAMTSLTDLDDPGSAFVTGVMVGKVDDATATCFGIAPDAGYFVSDKFSVGLGVAFNLMSEKANKDADAFKTTSFGVNPYVRYFAISKGNFGLYLQGGLSFISCTADEPDPITWKPKSGDAFNVFNIGINPGISYKLGDNFGVTAAFGYLGYASVGDDASAFGLNVDMSTLRFGLSWSF